MTDLRTEPVKGETSAGNSPGSTRIRPCEKHPCSSPRHRHEQGGLRQGSGSVEGKTVAVGTHEAIPRLEMLQRIANVTGLSFQIGIEPLETPESSSTKRSSKRAPTRKASAKKTTTRKPSRAKSSTRGRALRARRAPAHRPLPDQQAEKAPWGQHPASRREPRGPARARPEERASSSLHAWCRKVLGTEHAVPIEHQRPHARLLRSAFA